MRAPGADAHHVGRAVALQTACAVPGFITGSVVVQLREDFPVSELALGVAFSIYWGVAAVASAPAAKLVERIGPGTAMRLAGVIAAASCAAIALFVGSMMALIGLLAVGGLSISLATPGVNALFVRSVPPDRRALPFGLSQSGPPAGLLLAGLAVPVVAEPAGWRAVFVGAAVLALAAAAVAPHGEAGTAPGAASAAPTTPPDLRPLAVVMLGVTLANGALGALNAFLVAAAPQAGVDPSTAAITLAVGSAITIAFRIGVGARTDRRGGGDPLPMVIGLLVTGAVGFALVATQQAVTFLSGALLVLIFGWGWMGLFTFAVVARYAASPETATGVMQTGFFAGGVLGPVGFGLLVQTGSFTLGWIVATVGALAAAGAVAAARRVLPPHQLRATRIEPLLEVPPGDGTGGPRGAR
jgi:MFS family permease